MRSILTAQYLETNGYWSYLDSLIEDLRGKQVSGIQEKIADADNIQKLYSVVSELRIAQLLANRGKKVTLLPDNFMGSNPSSDILAKDSFGECYIEVKRLTEDHPSLLLRELLNSRLNKEARRYRVDVRLHGNLATPMVKRQERVAKEALIRAAGEEFWSWLESQDLANLPLTFQTGGVRFNVQETHLGKAFVGLVHSDVHKVPIEDWVEKLKEDVTEKAEKRTVWTGKDLEKFYVVAIDCEQISIERDDVDEALFGHRIPNANLGLDGMARQKILVVGIKDEWKPFLLEKHIISRERIDPIPATSGVFFTEEVTRNVSGVIVRFASGGSYCLPNPFAYEAINNPNLQHYLG